MIKPSLFIAGFLASEAIMCLIFYAVYAQGEDDLAAFWWFLGGGAVLGIIVGALLACFEKIGGAVLAGWGGFTAGLILNEMFVYRSGLEWLFWVVAIGCALIAVVLVFVMFDNLIIISTVTLGAYCLVRGVAVYAGHYYNEAYMAEQFDKGLLDDIDPWYWAYVGGFFFMILLGLCV